jgi:hypothetical protein
MTHPVIRSGLLLSGLRLGACGLLALALGCAMDGVRPDYEEAAVAIVEEAPLGGEALAQRKQDLQRALEDMTAFHATMASLIDRRDGQGLSVFDDFVATYVGTHLDPLLRAEWQSSHPEVMATDANLRFVKGEVMVQLRYPRRVQEVIEDIERRYLGRESMLVTYPIGEENTLGHALEILKSRKWEG